MNLFPLIEGTLELPPKAFILKMGHRSQENLVVEYEQFSLLSISFVSKSQEWSSSSWPSSTVGSYYFPLGSGELFSSHSILLHRPPPLSLHLPKTSEELKNFHSQGMFLVKFPNSRETSTFTDPLPTVTKYCSINTETIFKVLRRSLYFPGQCS